MHATASWLAWSMAIGTSSRWGTPIETSPGTRQTLVGSPPAGRGRRRAGGGAAGPRRESEGELTIVVAEGLTRLAAIIGGILMLGNLLAWLLYQRVAPGVLVVAAGALLAAALGRWQ